MTPPRIQTLVPQWGVNYNVGYIGFCGEDASFMSRGIAYLTRDSDPVSVSHVLVVTGPDECVEALGHGVTRSRLQPYFDSPRPLFLLPFVGYTPTLGAVVADNAHKCEGLPYGWGLLASNAAALSLTGRAVNGACNWLATETKNKWLMNLPNRLVSKLVDWSGGAPVCSVVGAECLHPTETAILARGVQDVVGPLPGLECSRIITPQSLFDNQVVFPR